jgi:histidinol dehydrogenase
MKIIKYPSVEDWNQILARPVFDSTSLFDKVGKILEDVKENGDKALKSYTLQFDKVSVEQIEVSREEIDAAASQINIHLKQAIEISCRTSS